MKNAGGEKFLPSKGATMDDESNELVRDEKLGRVDGLSPIYQQGNVVAVSGQASFYYVDNNSTIYDSPTATPVLLIASLSTINFNYPPDSPIYPYTSYSNSNAAVAAAVWQINNYFPTNLQVTEN